MIMCSFKYNYIGPCHICRYPILEAAAAGCDALVQLLVENGANFQVKDGDRVDALGHAAMFGHVSTVLTLIGAYNAANQALVSGNAWCIKLQPAAKTAPKLDHFLQEFRHKL